MEATALVGLAETVLQRLTQRGWTLATAESCTGGLLGHLLTEVPGSSTAYLGGVIAYANRVKMAHLDVPNDVLTAYGAVSRETAHAMAVGVRERFGVTVALATTGIAGPGGSTPQKPVGLVYLGLALPDRTLVERHVWNGDRSVNKLKSVKRCFEWLLDVLEDTA